MQKAIAMQIKVGWSLVFAGLRSNVSQFPNSDKHNKMVLTDKQKAVTENDFNEKDGVHTKSGMSIQVLNTPACQFIT